jgi:TatD DNase family protein
MWIDIHAHLYDLSAQELAGQMAQARDSGVSMVINAGTSIDTSQRAAGQCMPAQGLYATVGVSPFDVENLPPGWDTQLESLVDKPGVVGIGEIGLDNTNPAYPPLDKQVPVFERQIEIALRRNRPAVIHSRGAEDRAIDMCVNAGIRTAVLHCFTGAAESLERLLKHGYSVSFSGIVTFKKSPAADLVKQTPLDRLFIETDSPYLAPVPHRGKPNRPAWAALTGEKVAELLDVPPAEVAGAIAQNVNLVFGIECKKGTASI